MFLFFKQKTAYEMRISDWSSDVCSSDLSLDRQVKRSPREREGYVGGMAAPRFLAAIPARLLLYGADAARDKPISPLGTIRRRRVVLFLWRGHRSSLRPVVDTGPCCRGAARDRH